MSFKFLKTVRGVVKNWYLPLLAGIVLIAIGVYTFSQPEDAYVALAFVFSLSFVATGLFESIFAVQNREIMDGWGWNLALGLLTLIVGVLLLMNPEISQITLPFYVGFLILFRSIGAISTALDLRNYRVLAWGDLMVMGVLGVILSFILLWNPLFAGLSVVVWTGLAFIIGGILSIMLSFKLKKIHDIPKKISKDLKDKLHDVEEKIIDELEKFKTKTQNS